MIQSKLPYDNQELALIQFSKNEVSSEIFVIFPLLYFSLIIHAFGSLMTAAEPVPDELQRWLKPQSWNRDTQGPVIELGKADKFDDTHLFAPCVSFEKGQFSLWYCGSQGTVKKRVFQMGLAHSSDGIQFQKQANNPVFRFGDAKHRY